jgi:uncharacterized membrane protein
LQQSYPIVGVAFFAVVIAVETLVIWGILRPRSYDRSWPRALLALLFVSGVFLGWPHWTDGPQYEYAHLCWLAVVAALLFSLALSSFAVAIARRITSRSTRRATRTG